MHTIDEMREKRNKLALTYQDLSSVSGIPVPTIQKIFSGTTVSPRFSTIRKLEAVLFPESASQSNQPDPGSFEYLPGAGGVRESSAGYGHVTETFGASAGGNMVHEPSVAYNADPARPYIYDPNDWIRRLGKPQGTFTVADVEKIPEDQRYELIDGVLIKLEAPTFEHQRILAYLMTQLYRFTEDDDCDCVVVCAPFDVQLDRDKKTLVQPDVLVICDEKNVNKKRGVGAPDLCVEILSPSTRSKDQLLKRYKYEKAGVKEFWVIDPEYRRITVYRFDIQEEKVYSFEDQVPIGICAGKHAIDFAECRIGFRRSRRQAAADKEREETDAEPKAAATEQKET
jgi:Uma2 family endonuclease/transcriptional regulator with XRE-family HTH domain